MFFPACKYFYLCFPTAKLLLIFSVLLLSRIPDIISITSKNKEKARLINRINFAIESVSEETVEYFEAATELTSDFVPSGAILSHPSGLSVDNDKDSRFIGNNKHMYSTDEELFCKEGYYLRNGICESIDECSWGLHNCNITHYCVDQDDGYYCEPLNDINNNYISNDNITNRTIMEHVTDRTNYSLFTLNTKNNFNKAHLFNSLGMVES